MVTVWKSWGVSLIYESTSNAAYTSTVSALCVRMESPWYWDREQITYTLALASNNATTYQQDWDVSVWAGIDSIEAEPVRRLAQPFLGHAYRGSAEEFGGQWYNNIRWRVQEVVSAAALRTTFHGMLLPNEPDGTDTQFQQDMTLPGSDTTIVPGATFLARTVDVARESYEEAYLTSAKYSSTRFDGFIAGPVFAGTAFTTAAPSRFTLQELANYDDGSGAGCYGNYILVVTNHNHDVQTRIESFARAAPSTGGFSMYWSWRFAQLMASNLGVSVRWPCMNDETGIAWDHNVGDWLGHEHELKALSLGLTISMQFWYAMSLWHYWTTMGSTNPEMHLIDGSSGNNVPWPQETEAVVRGLQWKHMQMESAPKLAANTYAIPIRYKTWHGGSLRGGSVYANRWHLGYGDPRTWTVYALQNTDPAAASGTDYPNAPYTYWQRATFRDNEIKLDAHATERNLVMIPRILPSFDSTYTITADCQVTGNASGSIIFGARGYNNLNGILDAAATAAAATTAGNVNWVSLNFTFQPVKHDLRHPTTNAVIDFPDPCRCIVYYDHNGKGTAHIKNVKIKQN